MIGYYTALARSPFTPGTTTAVTSAVWDLDGTLRACVIRRVHSGKPGGYVWSVWDARSPKDTEPFGTCHEAALLKFCWLMKRGTNVPC